MNTPGEIASFRLLLLAESDPDVLTDPKYRISSISIREGSGICRGDIREDDFVFQGVNSNTGLVFRHRDGSLAQVGTAITARSLSGSFNFTIQNPESAQHSGCLLRIFWL